MPTRQERFIDNQFEKMERLFGPNWFDSTDMDERA